MTDVRSIELVPGVPGLANPGTPSDWGWTPVDGHHSCHVLLRRSFRPLEEPIVRWTAARKQYRVTGGNDAMIAFVGEEPPLRLELVTTSWQKQGAIID